MNYDELIKEFNEAIKERVCGTAMVSAHALQEAEQSIQQLQVENDALRADAERYRHIRLCLFENNCPWIDTPANEPKNAQEFDEAIDAAMKGE